MIIQCKYCLRYVHLTSNCSTVCQCGARYTVQMITGNTTVPINKDYDALYRQAVPKAFYDAFLEKELQP